MNVILIPLFLIISIVMHEYAHGYTAYRLGDTTPKSCGRLTLNPFKHIDVFGTIILPLLLLVLSAGNFSFGYAKPIEINPYHFKNPRKDLLWVGLAGLVVNILFIFLFVSILKVTKYAFIPEVLISAIILNIAIVILNIIPIPPLDGSRILGALLPYRISSSYFKMETFGSVAIILLVMLGFLKWFMWPLVSFSLTFLRINL